MRVAAQLEHDRDGRASRAAATASSARRRPPARRGTPPRGRPAGASSRPRTGWAWARTVAARDQRPGGRDRGLLRPAVDRGTPRLEVAAWCAERGHDATTSTPPRTTRSTASAGASPTTPTSWPASSASPPRARLRLGFAISPGLSIDYDDADDRAALGRQGRPGRGGRRRPRGARPRRHPLRRRPAGRGPRPRSPPGSATTSATAPTSSLVPTEYVGTRPSPHLDALGRGRARRRADRLDRAGRRQRHDHRRRRRGPRRVARRTAAAALGQLPRERRA